TVRGIERVPRRLLDRRRRSRRARVRDRGQSVVGARTWRNAARDADRGAAGDEWPSRRRVMSSGTDERSDLSNLLRDLAPQVLSAVARRYGDFAGAEDAVQEALIAAAEQWPSTGIPKNPSGWLYHVAMRRLTDHVRSELSRQRREEAAAGELWAEWAFVPAADHDVDVDEDDSLALLFMCCHPALTPPSAIAL